MTTKDGTRARRRRPRQERSKATVDAIMTAAAMILKADGYEGMTTRRIAERAGVSVGSLYQYFRSKDALVRGLAEWHREEVAEEVRVAMLETRGRPFEARVPVMIEALVRAKTRDPALTRSLFAAMAQLEGEWFLEAESIPFRRLVEAALAEHADELPPRDVELVAFTLVHALHGVLSGLILANRDVPPGLNETLSRLTLGVLGRT